MIDHLPKALRDRFARVARLSVWPFEPVGREHLVPCIGCGADALAQDFQRTRPRLVRLRGAICLSCLRSWCSIGVEARVTVTPPEVAAVA